jgi:Reverse transcriptase (RNA-dependent DNA polymerase)
MLALDKIQEAIVDDKNPPKHMLENEDYEPPTRRLMLKCKNHAKWEESEQDELRSFHLCKVLSKTPPILEGVKPLPFKWIYKLKKDLRNIILQHKARLVAQGLFQIFGIDYTETYSPVAMFVSIRIFLFISVRLGLIVHAMNVDNAFLNADIDEVIRVKIPEGTKLATNYYGIYKLKKSLYELKQASKNWNNDINDYLISNDITRLEDDPCIYVKIVEKMIMALSLHATNW